MENVFPYQAISAGWMQFPADTFCISSTEMYFSLLSWQYSTKPTESFHLPIGVS